MSFDNLSFCKRVIDNIEPVLFEATQRCNWWEADYNEQAHVEITLTIADVRTLAVLKELCKKCLTRHKNKHGGTKAQTLNQPLTRGEKGWG